MTCSPHIIKETYSTKSARIRLQFQSFQDHILCLTNLTAICCRINNFPANLTLSGKFFQM